MVKARQNMKAASPQPGVPMLGAAVVGHPAQPGILSSKSAAASSVIRAVGPLQKHTELWLTSL